MCTQEKSREDGVSPVVGVMLMLVVTIIIAAVVSAFAGGLGGTQQKTPQASIGIKTGYGVTDAGAIDKTQYDISFEHLGGDPIQTKDVQIITYLTLSNGTVVRHVQTASSNLGRGNTLNGAYAYSRAPHIYDNQKYGYPCNPANQATVNGVTILGVTSDNYESPAWFGKAVWMPGDIARTYRDTMTAVFLGLAPGWDKVSADSSDGVYSAAVNELNMCVQNQTQLEIKMLHVPSGKYILDKKVFLKN